MQKVRYFLIGLLLVGCASVQAANLKWYTNYDEAKTVAQKENKPMFLFFTGHGWCPLCIKLDKEVLSKPEFAELAGNKYVFVELDFPRNKPQAEDIRKQNDRLYNLYDVQGLPAVVLVNPQGKKLAQTSYMKGGPKAYAQHLSSLLAVLDFQDRIQDASMDTQAAIEPLVAYLEEHGDADAEKWKVEMTLAQYLLSQGCEEQAAAFASAGLADAPASHQPDIERFLTHLNA